MDGVEQEAAQRRHDFSSIVVQLAELRATQFEQGRKISEIAVSSVARDRAMDRVSSRSRIVGKRLRVIFSAQKKTRNQCRQDSATTQKRLMILTVLAVLFGLGGIPEVRLLIMHAAERLVGL